MRTRPRPTTTQPNVRNESFWLESLAESESVQPLRRAMCCDVAVVGGGFTGLSTAYHARQLLPGADVRVVEAGRCGFGASGRSAGFVSPLFGLNKDMTALRFGREKAIAAHRYMNDAVDFVDKLVTKHQLECDYERSGSLLIATTPAQERRITAALRLVEDWGLDGFEHRSSKELANEFHSARFRLGLFNRRSALVNPARLAQGMLAMARDAGVVVHEQSPVTTMEEVAAGFVLHTAEGTLRAKRLVLATNAFSHAFPALASKQAPVLSQIVLTEPLAPTTLRSIGWGSRSGFEDARTLQHYIRLTADNRILIGGGDTMAARRGDLCNAFDHKVFTHLEQHLLELFPQLSGVSFTHRWGGPVSLAVDMAPIIGILGRHKRAVFALGLNGHGVSMAPYNGLCLAELLAGQRTRRTEMFFVGRRALPWPPHIIRSPMLHVARHLMKLDDRLRWD